MEIMSFLIYTKRDCPWCYDLVSFLNQHHISFDEREVFGNEIFYKEMIELSGQSKAPTVIYKGEVYPDTDKKAIEKILKANKII